ncbi:MAG: hypothetical protein ACI32W_10035 [Enterococcus faecalis]
MAMLIQRNDLATVRKSELTQKLNVSEEFALLVNQVANFHQDIEIKETEAFELIFGGNAKATEVVFAKLNDEAIIQMMKVDDEYTFKAHYSAEVNGEKVIRKSIIEHGKAVLEQETAYKPEHFLFVEELKSPAYADIVVEGRIQESAWYEGCLSFYNSGNGKTYNYKNCGAKCTSSTYINTLDKCCQAHDRCWSKFGKGDNECDRILYNCANATSDPGWWMVAEFGLLCSQGKLGSIC